MFYSFNNQDKKIFTSVRSDCDLFQLPSSRLMGADGTPVSLRVRPCFAPPRGLGSDIRQ